MAITPSIKPLHPIFGAEIQNIDIASPLSEAELAFIKNAVTTYGVCVFRATGLNDETHSAFAHRFGDVETSRGPLAEASRLKSIEFTDQSNLDTNGEILDPNSITATVKKGDQLFHVDGSYNVRRCHYSILRAFELPPPGVGGTTDFADTRTAFSELPEEWKAELLEKDYVANHSFWHSRKSASLEYFAAVDVDRYPVSKHRIVQKHHPSGRMNLYVPSHIRSIDGLSEEETTAKLDFLKKHSTQEKYRLTIEWLNVGDLVVWDNTCVMHRATPLKGPYRRDMRRIGVFDSGPDAYGLNPKNDDLNFAFSKEVLMDLYKTLQGQG